MSDALIRIFALIGIGVSIGLIVFTAIHITDRLTKIKKKRRGGLYE